MKVFMVIIFYLQILPVAWNEACFSIGPMLSVALFYSELYFMYCTIEKILLMTQS